MNQHCSFNYCTLKEIFDLSPVLPPVGFTGTSIIQVTARDADDPTYGNSARLVYSVTQGQDYFSVDPQTGLVIA